MDQSTWQSAIEIPIHGEDEVLEVDLAELIHNPELAREILQIFKSEQSQPSLYLKIALECFKRGMMDEFETFLVEGLKVGRQRRDKVLVLLLNVIAYHFIRRARTIAPNVAQLRPERNQLMEQAAQYLREADQSNSQDALTHLVKGMLFLARDDADSALTLFDNLIKRLPDCFPAHLSKVIPSFTSETNLHRELHCITNKITRGHWVHFNVP
jgi:hypothetical protein